METTIAAMDIDYESILGGDVNNYNILYDFWYNYTSIATFLIIFNFY